MYGKFVELVGWSTVFFSVLSVLVIFVCNMAEMCAGIHWRAMGSLSS